MDFEHMNREELLRALRALSAQGDEATGTDADRVLHDLHVHQIELEMQNRELREAQSALEDSRNRYADLYDFAPVAYCTLSATGLVEELNLTASTLFGIDRSAAQGRPFTSLVALDNPKAFWQHLGKCAATRQAVVSEIAMRVRGLDIDAEVVSVPVLGVSATSSSFRTAITDITRLKHAEASERRLRERLQALDDAQVELSMHLANHDAAAFDAIVELITRRARALTKADMATLKLTPSTSDEVETRRPSWIEGLGGTQATHEIRVALHYGGHELGTLRVVRAALEDPFSAHERETLHVFAARVAAGLRVAMLSAVESRENQRLAALDLVGRQLTSLHSQTDARQAVARILDETADSFVDFAVFYLRGEEGLELVHVAGRHARHAREVERALREGAEAGARGAWVSEVLNGAPHALDLASHDAANAGLPVVRLAGLLGASALLVAPLRARDQTIGMLCFARSDLPFNQAEQLWVHEVALRCGLALDGVQLVEELRAALDWRETLLASISHDLRGPLSAIALSASSLLPEERREKEPMTRRQVDLIRRSAEHMNHMIDDLVFESLLVAGTFQLEVGPVSVPQLLSEACQMAEAVAAARGVRLEQESDPELAAITADDERLLRVLSNLIGNAIKFSPPGTNVRVKAKAKAEQVVFSVSDDGPGIPPEQQRLVFKRYWRGGRGNGGPGLGLGLYIAKAIVEAHGGELWLESKLGDGATFLFAVPVQTTSRLEQLTNNEAALGLSGPAM